jgi:transposase
MKRKTTLQNSNNTTTAIPRAQVIKLGLDVHADSIVVVRIVDGQTPQPAQRFSPEKFLAWVQKQLALAEKVYACYEAGPMGYSLHRALTALDIVCYVVRPRDWDEYGARVKTDGRDAHELALCLDRYVSGNTKAFCLVRVPTPAEEQRRSRVRLRQALQNHKQRLAAQGRSYALYYGHRLSVSTWWKGQGWTQLEQSLPPHLLELLESLRALLLSTELELNGFTRQIEQSVDTPVPRGVGKLTAQILEREVADWSRFKNRRQVGSYTGLCPSEDSSGPRRFQGHVNKHGNRRIRPILIECAWRLLYFQPNYRLVRKWRLALCKTRNTGARRKQIIVALARQFAVDWWRIRTGRTTPEALGLAL